MNTFEQEPTSDGIRARVIETPSGEAKAPKRIIQKPAGARAIYNKFRSSHIKRILLYSEIKGLIQGNPPFDPNELRAAGLQHISNFNDMSARSYSKRGSLAYWNLLYNSVNIVRFELHPPGMKDPQLTEWADKMARHWTYAVNTYWPSFQINVNSLATQLVQLGISPVLFPDEKDPRWRLVELSRFFVPDGAQSDLDMLTSSCVETDYTIQYLYGVYQKIKDKPVTSVPWNAKALARLLLQKANQLNKEQTPLDFVEMERKLGSGDISFDSMYNDTVRLVSLFQKEYSGKISHYMFHRDTTVTAAGEIEEDFLFFEHEQFSDINEALILFTMSPGEYTIYENRGLGHEIFSLAQGKIMLDNSVVDMARWASSPVLKSSTLQTKDVEQIRFFPGVPINIGGLDFVENTMGANIQEVIGAGSYLASIMQFNIAYSGSDPAQPDPDKGSLNPTQTKIAAFREFSVLKNNIMHFYSVFDRLAQNMTAKMLRSKEGYPGYEIAQCWKERCLEDGVPELIFEMVKDQQTDSWRMPKGVEVYATRAAGAGSQVALLLALQEMQPIVASLPVKGQQEYKRLMVIATIGPEYVDTFLQEEMPDEQSGGASLAGVENAIMQAGKSPIFSPDNEHRAHFVTHMALNSQIIQMLQQKQTDPIQANSIFQVSIPHTGEHLQALLGNPFSQAFGMQVKKNYDDVARYAQLNKKNAAKMVQAQMQEQQLNQDQQQQVMNDAQRKDWQAQNEEQRKDMKLHAQMDRQEEAGAAKEEALRKKTDSEIQISQKKAHVEVQGKILQNTATQDAAADPSGYLKELNGKTPAPFDIEPIK